MRPLKSKRAAEVAFELLKVPLEFGAPHILQSDQGREFTADVIKELMDLWPDAKIVHGRPRHPEAQGSVERSNQDVENMLRSWMDDNNSTKWSIGCYFVQWQKKILHYTELLGDHPIALYLGVNQKLDLKAPACQTQLSVQLAQKKNWKIFTMTIPRQEVVAARKMKYPVYLQFWTSLKRERREYRIN